MSKTFKSVFGKELTVTKRASGSFSVTMGKTSDDPMASFIFEKDIAAEFMLAIAEASGITATRTDTYTVGEPDNLARIAADLQHHIERRDARTKEAADRDVLWQEASDLYHSVFPDNPCYSTPAKMPEHLRDGWVRAALKAREIHGGTK